MSAGDSAAATAKRSLVLQRIAGNQAILRRTRPRSTTRPAHAAPALAAARSR